MKHVGPQRACLAILVLILAYSLAGCGPPTRVLQTSERPNVVFILTDDLDARLLEEHSANYPNLGKLAEEGTTFENAFVTDPLCCPSRATFLRGQYSHNHQIVGNWWPQGGSRKFRELGREGSTVATWLQDGGYRTVLIGKYMNDYYGTRVPQGWDDWYGISGNYLSNDLNENGNVRHYDSKDHHLDDVLAEKATDYVRRMAGNDRPFFMWLGTQAPHAPAAPAPRHEDAFPDATLPRLPSFDEKDVSDKPDWVRDNPSLDRGQVAVMKDRYRNRLRSMLAVDEMIGQLMGTLKGVGELDSTYVFFTSDNGWHAGEHRLSAGKWTAYEEDTRVPLVVRGPGVPEGRTLSHLVLNNDLTPTFANLAGVTVPNFVDGRSLKPVLEEDPPPPGRWREAFLVEAASELGERSRVPPLSGDAQPGEDQRPVLGKGWGRPGLGAVRTAERLYVEYGTGERELYDLKEDPYQLVNRYDAADPKLVRRMEERLEALRGCAGATCKAAEDGHP